MGVATHTNSKDTKTSNADLLARLAALEEENKRLKEQRNAKLSLKVSEKGCVSYYGLGRFPIFTARSGKGFWACPTRSRRSSGRTRISWQSRNNSHYSRSPGGQTKSSGAF